MQRIILHVDLDSFYASLEELRNEDAKGKPIVICVYSGRSADSGAVSTANYKARELGIKAGMPIVFAKRLAKEKDVVFLPNDIEYYRTASERIMSLIEEDADAIEQVSIDEAYLDITKRAGGNWEQAQVIAEEIKKKIKEHEGLTCSVGVGPNKLVAKMASGYKKPDSLTVIRDTDVTKFFSNLPVLEIHGIGSKTTEALNHLGIKTARGLADFDTTILEKTFGKNKAKMLQDKAKGIDDSPVEQEEAQQISRIKTLKEDSDNFEVIFIKIGELVQDLKKRIDEKSVTFRTISLITIDTNLKMQTKTETIQSTDDSEIVLKISKILLEKFLAENPRKRLRRVGVRVSNFESTITEGKTMGLDSYFGAKKGI